MKGYYSEKQVYYTGTSIYTTPDGGEVEVTEIAEGESVSKWDDLRFVGEVTTWKRCGQPKKDNQFEFPR